MAGAIAWADIRTRLESAQISVNGVLLPIAYPNTDFNLPTQSGPWMRVDLSQGASLKTELGEGGMWLEQGQTMIDVMVMTGTGLDDSIAIIDQLKTAFRGPPYLPVTYTGIAADPSGSGTDDGLYWVASMRADWHVQTIVEGQ